MKVQYKISGKKAEVESRGPQDWTFEARAGGWILARRVTEDGREERLRFAYLRRGGRFFAKFAGPEPVVEFHGDRSEGSFGGSAATSASDYTAQFPGKVRKISVKAGESVEAGAPLMMVEAMKMEFAIKAGAKGKVLRVLVAEGAQLTPGQVLLEFEEDA